MANATYADQVRQFADLIVSQQDHGKLSGYRVRLTTGQVWGGVELHDMPTPTYREMFTERTVDDLGKVRDTILERGWIQGNAMTVDGVCLLGGIGETVGWRTRRNAILATVLEIYLGRLVGLGRIGIHTWNDSPVRTFGEVITVLDDCIAWVKEKING
jgi:hypothetical protein